MAAAWHGSMSGPTDAGAASGRRVSRNCRTTMIGGPQMPSERTLHMLRTHAARRAPAPAAAHARHTPHNRPTPARRAASRHTAKRAPIRIARADHVLHAPFGLHAAHV